MKKLLTCFLAIVFMFSTPAVLLASAPFQSYTFDFYGFRRPIPNPYIPLKSISGRDLGLAPFVDPSDFYVLGNTIYLLDSGSNSIIIFDEELNLIRVISEFNNNGVRDTFNRPQGIFVSPEGIIYVADTENHRVVVLDENNNSILIISDPQSDSLPDDFIFAPMKLVADASGRVYVVARHMFEGIMSFNREGEFFGFFGRIDVTFSPIDMFWRTVATQAQRARQRLFLPTEFSNIAIDNEGFIYATIIEPFATRDFVMRINPLGRNVLINYTPSMIIGDLDFFWFGEFGGTSSFVDIIYRGYGMYSALDFTRNRIFTYDAEGNLLYVFGGPGNALGMLVRPVAIEHLGDNILVLDAARREIVFYEPTEYGHLINRATVLRYLGDEAQAVEYWRKVLRLDAHNELAFVGIGRSLLATGQYREAMTYLERGMDVRHYSIAFSRYRNQLLRENLPVVFTVLLVGVIAFVSFKVYKIAKSGRGSLKEGVLDG